MFNNVYIPEFNTAVKYFKNKTTIQAEVYAVKPHGIYLNVIEDKIQAKIPLDKNEAQAAALAHLKSGDKLNVFISHLSKSKIVVEPVVETQDTN